LLPCIYDNKRVKVRVRDIIKVRVSVR
jgi:hypothetical protein